MTQFQQGNLKDFEQLSRLVPRKSIKLPAKQPRRYFDPYKLEQLIASVREYGILEPLIVRPISNNTYELVAGERRYRAATEVGLDDIPVVIRELNEQQAWELALLENLQRDDLNPIDETEGLLDLLSQSLQISQTEIVSLLNRAANTQKRGKALTNNDTRQIQIVDDLFQAVGRFNRESFRTNRLPLLKMPEDVLEVLRQGQLEYTKAKTIARVGDVVKRRTLMQEAIDEQLSLREIKKRISTGKHVDDVQVYPRNLSMPASSNLHKTSTTDKLSESGHKLRDELMSILLIETESWNDEEKCRRIREIFKELKEILDD